MSIALTFIANQLEMERVELHDSSNAIEMKMRARAVQYTITQDPKRDSDELWYALPSAIREAVDVQNDRSIAWAMNQITIELHHTMTRAMRYHRVKFEDVLCSLR